MVKTAIDEDAKSKSEDKIVEKQTETKRLNLLGMQLKPLHLCGILPPASFSATPWKSSLYNVFTTLAIFWFVPHIIAQIMALYKHWNKFETVTALIFQIALFFNTATAAAYFVFQRKELVRLLESLETHFVPYVEKISTPTKYAPIIKEASRKAAILVWFLLALCWFVLFSWVFLPLTVRNLDMLTSTDDATEEPLDLPDDYLKYFALIIWLPPNIHTSPMYELVLIFDSIAAYVVDSNLTGTNTIFFIFMFNISTHFKILASCIQDIDEMFPDATEATMNETFTNREHRNALHGHLLDDEMFGPPVPEAVMISGRKRVGQGSGISLGVEFRGEFPSEIGGDNRRTSGLLASVRKGNDFVSNLSEDTTPRNSLRDEEMHRYLIDCIKYHQALLE
jgi:hypothetical protein